MCVYKKRALRILRANTPKHIQKQHCFSAPRDCIGSPAGLQVDFGGSVWNLPLILDFRSGLWDVLFSSILLIVNIGMQAMFSTILFSEHFAGAGVDVEEELEHARLWRTSIAHDWRYMDLSETSLASRVCKSDAALILSTPQAELVDHINSFLGLQTGEFKPGFLQPGILLCMLCILHWGLCVYKEFRSIWSTLEAVATIPRSSRTTKSEHYIHSLSLARFIVFFLTCVVRAAIASILLMAGINWLARTSSIEELMLNAVALNGIMDVDELLFAAFTPLSIQHQLQRLRPVKMKYTSGRSQRESVVLFFLLLATVLIPYFVLLQPLGDGMLEIKKEMCGGNLTFVVGYNPDVQEVVGYVTQAARSTEEQSLSELAVNQHKFLNQQDQFQGKTCVTVLQLGIFAQLHSELTWLRGWPRNGRP
ncbi:unnamed protein product [Durusdinium trenchii]|uniref:Uncharacterized protein n=1 Tax=Durusdinium trenchii TaxID=1381693 RepID=A0ABP0JYK5_9DINO